MSNSKTVKILALSANPIKDQYLRLDAEVRGIREELERAQYRDRFVFISEGAVRPDDLSLAILKHKPDIVHFSGHGTGEEGLVLEDDSGKPCLASTEALSRLFKWSRSTVKCVVLNACFSKVQAEAIYQNIDCVIGMNQPIGDRAAIRFAAKFYQALANGEAFQSAYTYACNALDLAGSKEFTTPELLNRMEGHDPLGITAASPEAEPQQIAEPPPLVRQQSQSIGNISVSGSNNPFNFNAVVAGGNASVNQTSTQTSSSNTDLQTALAALAELKQKVTATNELSAFTKRDTESKINMLEEELQKSKPDKSFVNEVVNALKQGLSGVITLAAPVVQVAELIAKAWGG